MRRHPDFIQLSDHVMGEMHGRIENRSLHVDVQNISQVKFANLRPAHLQKSTHHGIDTHANLNVELDGDRILRQILYTHQSKVVHILRNLVNRLGLLVDNHQRQPPHRLEHPIKHIDVLKEAIREEIIFCNDRRSEENDRPLDKFTNGG